jgi:menaquinone-dependent protoporphyrinogen oxidase
MRVLVTAASKHGATMQIGESIAGVLRQRGCDVEVSPLEHVHDVESYDAVVLGSAVYIGHWLADAKRFVSKHQDALASRPVWLFSSGPIGEPALPRDEALDIPEMVRLTAARGHRTFAGKLEREKLSLPERAVVTAVRAQVGDFRDWRDVEDWAAMIADDLTTARPAVHAASSQHQEGGPS